MSVPTLTVQVVCLIHEAGVGEGCSAVAPLAIVAFSLPRFHSRIIPSKKAQVVTILVRAMFPTRKNGYSPSGGPSLRILFRGRGCNLGAQLLQFGQKFLLFSCG